jgi:hypothetical protein
MRLGRAALLALLSLAGSAQASSLPPIVASADNAVPACITPAALMRFVEDRNAKVHREIDPRFTHIATLYQKIGTCVARPPEKCVGVRWDYAFFQMLIETNYLTFRRPDGAPASVPPTDNNFAGVGAAISGKPGEHFNDAASGVLAHLQHVLMYSNTRIPEPVAKRTRQVQDDVQAIMRRLNRPVTYADLARQWTGVGKSSYAQMMQRLAEKYSERFCGGESVSARAAMLPVPTTR